MLRKPLTRTGRFAPLLTAALCLPGNFASGQNTPAGAPPAAPPATEPAPAADKAAALQEAAVKPAVPEAPAPEEAPESLPEEAPLETAMEPLPEPPPVSPSLTGGPAEEQGPGPGFSENVTINLLRLLVKNKTISQADAEKMIIEAEEQAAQARTEAKTAVKKAAAAEDEALTVSHVPEIVRNQMRDEIKQQLLAELRSSDPVTGDTTGKGSPQGSLPAKDDDGLFGDIRIRYELIDFASDNDISGSFPNFHSINTGSPFDTSGVVFSPQYNVDQDRNRYRLRFRLAGEYDIKDDWRAGFRIATGENSSPVTTNQSAGLANQGAGGNFSKYAIWLDRAFMRYDHEWEQSSMTLWGGRFDNPFYSTDIIFDEDLGFDGLAVKMKTKLSDSVKPFATAGAFPIFNTDLNFSSNQPSKFASSDKFLFAAQLGTDFKLAKDLTGKVAVSYYIFDGAEGKLSTPYTPINAQDAGDTDNTRPSFAQRGNTYRPLRQIIPDASNNFGTTNQWQYYGLATAYRPLSITGKLDWDHFEPVRVTAFGEFIKNTAFDADDINAIAVNNRGPVPTGGGTGAFEGSDTAWIAGVKVGHPALDKRGAWQAGFNYRWVGSDAVIDGFNDSEFGGGGTNLKGWTLGGSWALSRSAAVGLQWMSSSAIAGPPLEVDYLQLDLKIKF